MILGLSVVTLVSFVLSRPKNDSENKVWQTQRPFHTTLGDALEKYYKSSRRLTSLHSASRLTLFSKLFSKHFRSEGVFKQS